MSSRTVFAAIISGAMVPALAQNVSDAFEPGNSIQSWQDPRLPELRAECRNPAPAFSIPTGTGSASDDASPEPPAPAASLAIAGVIAAGQHWETVWSWGGNNADGMIATEEGGVMFANNDASNVIRINADGTSAEIVHDDTNTGGALSRNKQGELFLLERGLNSAIVQLEPERRLLADSFEGDPLDCLGGIMNDLVADSRGGAYFTISAAGLFYADAEGLVSRFGDDVVGTNGIILSPDESVLYVTNGSVVVAFDVEVDGSLTNQRDFAELSSGRGDGMTVDAEGRLYVSNGSGVDIFSAQGVFLGNIPGPQGLHGVAFSGADKDMLYAIVFTGGITGVNRANRVIRIPMIARGYAGRAK